jgi:hypothetical protein
MSYLFEITSILRSNFCGRLKELWQSAGDGVGLAALIAIFGENTLF